MPPDGGRTADNPRHGRRRLHRRRRRPCARRARPAPHRHGAAEALPAPYRGRRLRVPDPPLLRDLPRQAVRAVAHLAVPARPQTRPAARAPTRAGRDLRRRWLDGQPARDLARAGARHDPARGVGAGRRARRLERRLDVLVRVGRHDLVRRAADGARARLPPGFELGAPRQRAGPSSGLLRGRPHRSHSARLGRRRRRRADLPPHRPRGGRHGAEARSCV